MKWSHAYGMKMMLVGIVAFIVLSSGRAKADFTFGEPTNLGPTVNSSSGDSPGCFSSDGLEMYMDSSRPGGSGSWDIWVTTRETIDDEWGAPVNLGPNINFSWGDVGAFLSSEDLEMYFCSYNSPSGYGYWDIWLTKRAAKEDPWGEPENLGPPVNTSAWDGYPSISSDGLELYFSSRRSGGYGSDDMWVSRRTTINDPWEQPVNLGAVVNSSASESFPFLSSDGLLLLFSEEINSPLRSGGFGNEDIWMTRRKSVFDPWSTPVNLGPIVNNSTLDGSPRISPDGSMLYFCSNRTGGSGSDDIYQAPIIPIVDFNGDGEVG